MIAQGVLPFRYEAEPTGSGMTALAGLPRSQNDSTPFVIYRLVF